MKLRHSREGRKDRSAKRSFFSKMKNKVLIGALAVGMAVGLTTEANAGKNIGLDTVCHPKARFWLKMNRRFFYWTPADKRKDRELVDFIADKMWEGVWYSRRRVPSTTWPVHPRCPPTLQNGDCWAVGFRESWNVTTKYCGSPQGAGDNRCVNGKPRQEPPGFCYGYTDFKKYVKDCELPFLPKRPSSSP